MRTEKDTLTIDIGLIEEWKKEMEEKMKEIVKEINKEVPL